MKHSSLKTEQGGDDKRVSAIVLPGLSEDLHIDYWRLVPNFEGEYSPSELDEGRLFTQAYNEKVIYCEKLGDLIFNGCKWVCDSEGVKKAFGEFADEQLSFASSIIGIYNRKLEEAHTNEEDKEFQKQVKIYTDMRSYFRKYREETKIRHALSIFRSESNKQYSEFDANPFVLNTPNGIVDLKTGAIKPCKFYEYCTMSTSVSPSNNGKKEWDKFLDSITCNDLELKNYLQSLMGLCCIGKTYDCGLYYAFGNGGNGKSTFFNTVSAVLGDYSTTLSGEILIDSNDNGKKFLLAELKGKRYAIIPELKDKIRLDDYMLKVIASSDAIQAQKKNKDPFTFIPSHTSVVYSNSLPFVQATDLGTWDRLRVVPFNARFRNTSEDVKDMQEKLYSECGGAALAWMIEGAKRFVQQGFKLDQEPQAVKEATSKYRTENDVLYVFRKEKIEDGDFVTRANEAHLAFNRFLKSQGQKPMDERKIKQMFEKCGYEHGRDRNGGYYRGFKLVS